MKISEMSTKFQKSVVMYVSGPSYKSCFDSWIIWSSRKAIDRIRNEMVLIEYGW